MQALKRHPFRTAIACLCMFLVVGAADCGGDDSSDANKNESKTRDNSYRSLVAQQPAHSMPYSPTRQTINAWIDTWGKRGQLSFTYLRNQANEATDYFVFLGPPVSYCAALTPTEEGRTVYVNGDPNTGAIFHAPSVDGVYYSGGQCNQYYGIDATTKQILEFSIGGAQNYISSTQPLESGAAAKPAGPTSINDLPKDASGKYVAP